MGALRVVMYAEGGGETSGEFSMAPAPGNRLGDDALGPGHLLVRRAIVAARSIPEAAVLFEEPLRTRRGRRARGSDLLDATTLAQLLTWGTRDRQPDLCVVLVDCDGDNARKGHLDAAVRQQAVSKVIAVPVQEFEAWLIADHQAVAKALGGGPSSLGLPESLPRRKAKEELASWIAAAAREGNEVRRTLALTCDLETVRKMCRAFEDFRSELAAVRV